jgi:hypothetical protein
LATPCDTFALKLAEQERIKENNMFKYIVKNEGIVFDHERYYKGKHTNDYFKVIT